MVHERISSAPAPVLGAGGTCPGLGVLVVEDHPQLRHSICQGLQSCGWRVWSAKDGRVAVDLYSRLRESIHVVLCDVQMPHLDGPQTLEAIQSINPDVKFCFMTADSSSRMLDLLLGRGALYIFIKPFRVQDIARHLQSTTQRRPRQSTRKAAAREPELPDGVVERLWRAMRGWFGGR